MLCVHMNVVQCYYANKHKNYVVCKTNCSALLCGVQDKLFSIIMWCARQTVQHYLHLEVPAVSSNLPEPGKADFPSDSVKS